MSEQIDIFADNNNERNDMDESRTGKGTEREENKDDTNGTDPRLHTYTVTPTKMSLHDVGTKLVGRFNWVTNSVAPYSGSNVIHIDYNLDYPTIDELYQQNRIITYQVDDEYTTWINKSVKRQRRTQHHRG